MFSVFLDLFLHNINLSFLNRNSLKKIYLKKKKEAAVERFHPWIFSGAIHKMEGEPEDGALVSVHAQDGRFMASGHFQRGSISVRLISFEDTTIDQQFWNQKIRAAIDYRQSIGLLDNDHSDCYRLIHAEGDGMPGLIIDIYGATAVIQCHSIGMHENINELSEALKQNFPKKLSAIYNKSKSTLPGDYAAKVENGYLWGDESHTTVKEHHNLFKIDWVEGQKTGFFLDQRDNRYLLGQYATEKAVLNTFAYSGGFSIYALQQGASRVDSVDVSQAAVDLINDNIQLNGYQDKAHRAVKADVIAYLKDVVPNQYDIIILDPPAFAKNISKRHNAVQGYKRLNKIALEKIKSGGVLFTFSCSQVVDKTLFYNTVVAAALEAGRKVRTMHHLTQPADHPVNLFHPEGAYLKGLVLYVE